MGRISIDSGDSAIANLLYLTDALKGPPDHKVSRFKVSISAPGGPIGIAPRRPFPTGYVVRMMSLPMADVVDHSDFAAEGCIDVNIVKSDPDCNVRMVAVKKLALNRLYHGAIRMLL
jgi:hypothetical protein